MLQDQILATCRTRRESGTPCEFPRFCGHLNFFAFLNEERNADFDASFQLGTLLSKTTDVPEVGLEITRQAIEMKTEIEKLREQALNIE